jgi:putative peptidoglycan lipid II flippase
MIQRDGGTGLQSITLLPGYNVPSKPEKTASDARYILFNTFSIASLTLIVKLAGAAKSVVAARFFGAGDALDCYLIAFLIPAFLSDVLAGAINPTLVPSLIEAAECKQTRSVQDIYAYALYRGTALLAITGGVCLACARILLPIVGSGFNPGKLSLARTLMIMMIPVMPLSAAGAVWRSVLNARGRFVAAAVSPVLTPVIIIAFVPWLSARYGVLSLAAGTTAGGLMELIALAVALRFADIPILPAWRFCRTPRPQVRRQYGSIVMSNLALGGTGIVNQAMAAMLGAGSVSVLALGGRAVGLLLAVGPSALMIAILPRLAQMVALGRWFALRRTVRGAMFVSMSSLAVVSTLMAVFSKPLVHLVFQRGEFTAADTLTVAHLQSLLAFQLPFVVGSAILMRVVVLLKLRRALILISVCSIVLAVVLNTVFMGHSGVAGIAMAVTVGQALILIGLSFVVFRFLNRACRETPVVS